MNAFLWVLQIGLGLFYFAGGAYKVFMYQELANQAFVLSRGAWTAMGCIEMLGAILLVIPASGKWAHVVTPAAAAVLALESLVLAGNYARFSLELTAANPLVWALGMGLLTAVIAYGRVVRPLAPAAN